MPKLLILHSSVDGHTIAICRRIGELLKARGCEVSLHAIVDCGEPELLAADGVVIGASIRYGHHRPCVAQFIRKHRALLDAKPNALFSVGLVARKPGKDQADTNPYLRKFLRKLDWPPKIAAVFAGRLDYPRYTFLDRLMIRLIMRITGGPTDPLSVVEYTDWAAVDAFAEKIAASL